MLCDATELEGVWSPTQNVAVQTEANVVAIFFFHQCGFYDPTHHIRGCQKIIWNFALKGRALAASLALRAAALSVATLQIVLPLAIILAMPLVRLGFFAIAYLIDFISKF